MSASRGQPGTWQYLAFWSGGVIDPDATLRDLPADDVHTAIALMNELNGYVHYAHGSGTWYLWDGRCHRPAVSGEQGRLISDYALRMRRMLEAARQIVFERAERGLPATAGEAALKRAREQAWAPFEPAAKYAAGLLKAGPRAALLTVLADHAGIADEEMEERNPGLLNFANGTVDLGTGFIRPHNPADMITYCLDVNYQPGSRCERFLALAHRMLGGDTAVLWYLLKLAGYALLGDNREQKIIFINGPTGSGKSQFLYILTEVLGALAHSSQPDLITVVRHGRNARTENSIRGARVITITETSQYMNIEEAQLKRLTGEAMISVDQHYAKTELKTPVTWLIFVATNQLPTLTNFDAAMRRRIIVIPGGPTIPDELMDTRIAAKILSAEREGILALLVAGCAEYCRTGTISDWPLAVQMATESYQTEQNTVANFVADTMVIGGWSADGIHQQDTWRAYQDWSTGSSRLGRNEFYEHLRKVPGMNYDDASRRFRGVAWNREWAGRVS